MEERKKGTRCTVCTYCGRCFEETDGAAPAKGWSGERCDVCVGCGKCMREWGLISDDDSDAESGPTNWADAFKVMDTGFAGDAPPIPAAPGVGTGASSTSEDDAEPDAATGATPGVASACKDLGLDDMACVTEKLGIKPPGQI